MKNHQQYFCLKQSRDYCCEECRRRDGRKLVKRKNRVSKKEYYHALILLGKNIMPAQKEILPEEGIPLVEKIKRLLSQNALDQ